MDQIRAEYYKEKEGNIRMEEQLAHRIPQQKSKQLMEDARQREVEVLESTTSLKLYKSLYEDLSTKNRYDEMRVVKVESEVEKYYQIVKDLQSLSDSNSEMGKKVYELEISKRNEEIVNKKYDGMLEEIRLMQDENSRLSEESMDKEREIINAHFFFQDKANLMQLSIDQLHSQILPTLNPHKVNDILLKIRDISSSKTQLEKENK